MRRNRKEWEKIFQDFQQSGMRQGEYCKKMGINKGTFSAMKIQVYGKKSPERGSSNVVDEGKFKISKSTNPFLEASVVQEKQVKSLLVNISDPKMCSGVRIFNIPVQFDKTPCPSWFANMILELNKLSG